VRSRAILFSAAIIVASQNARALDMSKLTCRAFFASGHDNIAAMIMWLRGYHAGRTGTVIAGDSAEMQGYGTRLGNYCKEHPDSSVLDASEHALTDEDRGNR
jgi:hypothetical protein